MATRNRKLHTLDSGPLKQYKVGLVVMDLAADRVVVNLTKDLHHLGAELSLRVLGAVRASPRHHTGFVSVLAGPDSRRLADYLSGADLYPLVARALEEGPTKDSRPKPPWGHIFDVQTHKSIDDAIDYINNLDIAQKIGQITDVPVVPVPAEPSLPVATLPLSFLEHIQLATEQLFAGLVSPDGDAWSRLAIAQAVNDHIREQQKRLLTPVVADLLQCDGTKTSVEYKRAVARAVNGHLRANHLAIEDPHVPGAACSVVVSASPTKKDGYYVLQRRRVADPAAAVVAEGGRRWQSRVGISSLVENLTLIYAPREEGRSHEAMHDQSPNRG